MQHIINSLAKALFLVNFTIPVVNIFNRTQGSSIFDDLAYFCAADPQRFAFRSFQSVVDSMINVPVSLLVKSAPPSMNSEYSFSILKKCPWFLPSSRNSVHVEYVKNILDSDIEPCNLMFHAAKYAIIENCDGAESCEPSWLTEMQKNRYNELLKLPFCNETTSNLTFTDDEQRKFLYDRMKQQAAFVYYSKVFNITQ